MVINIAHAITSTNMPHLVMIAPVVTSIHIAKVFVFYLFY